MWRNAIKQALRVSFTCCPASLYLDPRMGVLAQAAGIRANASSDEIRAQLMKIEAPPTALEQAPPALEVPGPGGSLGLAALRSYVIRTSRNGLTSNASARGTTLFRAKICSYSSMTMRTRYLYFLLHSGHRNLHSGHRECDSNHMCMRARVRVVGCAGRPISPDDDTALAKILARR